MMTIVARSQIDRLVGLVRLNLLASNYRWGYARRWRDSKSAPILAEWNASAVSCEPRDPFCKVPINFISNCVGMLMCRKTYQGKITNQAQLTLLRWLQIIDHVIFSLCVFLTSFHASSSPAIQDLATVAVQNARLGPLDVAMLGLDVQLLYN